MAVIVTSTETAQKPLDEKKETKAVKEDKKKKEQ